MLNFVNGVIFSKTLENFITTTEDLNQSELDWIEIGPQLPDLIFTDLITCHNLSFRIKQFRAQTLFLIGRTYRIISELKIQQQTAELNKTSYISITLPISKWSPLIMDVIKAQQLVEVETGNKSKGGKSSQLQKSNVTAPTHSYLMHSDVGENNLNADNLNENSDIVGSIENSSLHLILEQENFKVNNFLLLLLKK